MKVREIVKRFFRDERGLEGSEYALLLALICIFIVTAVLFLRGEIAAAFNEAANVIANRG